ncbi:MAG: hypothetical protein HY023_02635 [Chloroflexi bacterium]|nr:hypothetical protein [Chloroflexota bacterium]
MKPHRHPPFLLLPSAFILLSLACAVLTGPYLAPPATATLLPSPTATLPASTVNPNPSTSLPSTSSPRLPSPTAPPQSPAANSLADVWLEPSDIITHPDAALYSGDQVSFEVLAHSYKSVDGLPVTIYRETLGGEIIAKGQYEQSGLAGREQATFYWAWDTAGLVGPQPIVVALDPAHEVLNDDPDLTNNVITVTLQLLPANDRPQPEPEAGWTSDETDCCVFYYITHTAAERDLARIESTADHELRAVEERLGVRQRKKLRFTLLSRLLGHGGFASETISITYIDRDYAGGDLPQVFRHEATHILDRQLADLRPTLLTEGLAVYIAGGHFKVENLEARAAALVALGRYISLAQLADDFYPSQHETGYLEGGAFIDYLVKTYGWDAFKTFYGSFRQAPSDSAMLDGALQLNFGKNLAAIESDWLARLRAVPTDSAQIADLRDSVAFYDTVRRYQQLMDPSAFYADAWLPDTEQMRERGIVADYVRHPDAPENVALETMLVEASGAIAAGDFARAEWLIASVNAVLGTGVTGANAFADPLAAQYLAVVQSAEAEGYEPQHISLNGPIAHVAAIGDWPTIAQLTFTQSGGEWQLSSN